MSEGATAHPSPTMAYLPPDGDPVFGFLTTKWIEPANPASIRRETEKDRQNRLSTEATYRQNTNPTSWYRYCTLGRYAVDGTTFDTIWNEFEVDPLRAHCLIWYNYMFHVDRNMDVPSKLESWATNRSQVYLAIHAASILTVDTTCMSWKALTIAQEISTPWTTVGNSKPRSSSSKQTSSQSKQTQSLLPFKRASTVLGEPATPTITEGQVSDSASPLSKTQKTIRKSNTQHAAEVNDTSSQTYPTKTNPKLKSMDKLTMTKEHPTDTSSQTASVGKMSALIPNLDVPLNDGTHRITIRWKVDFDLQNSSKNAADMTARIYDFLNELFSDDDGLLYKWGHDDLNHFNSISQMTPSEVRSFISPSITLVPTQSMIIIPIRFGFSGKTPSAWRNKITTKMTLEHQKATLSISNSKTTSGKLVIAGYILLKAPMTTHRIRYLQSLRSTLPDSTPHFDILLHRKTPLEQNINHLVVQCGEKHVHPLSQALLTTLTGYRSPVYIPRFAFADMSTEQATKLFETHDLYIKSLRSIPLFPLLTNLDTLRTEYFPDGNTLERSTRDWATGILSIDGTESAKCDVVNGGLDQKAYLLVPPQFEEAAKIALEDYRRRVFPFTQREARFRDSVGPPAVIHVKAKIDADIQLIESLSSKDFWQQAPSSVKPTQANFSQQNDSVSNTSMSTASEQTSHTRPPTPSESLRERYNNTRSSKTQTRSDVTTATFDTSRSPGISMNSSHHNRLKELESIISRQQKDIHTSNKVSADKFQQLEIQFQRQLQEVQNDMTTHIKSLETTMITSMQQQVMTGDSMKELNAKIERLTDAVALLLSNSPKLQGTVESSSSIPASTNLNPDVAHNPDEDASMKTSSTDSSQEIFSSPQHKKPRSAQKDERNTDVMEFSTPVNSDHESDDFISEPLSSDHQLNDSGKSTVVTVQGEATQRPAYDGNSEIQSSPQSHTRGIDQPPQYLAEITADLEARYNPNAPGGGHAT